MIRRVPSPVLSSIFRMLPMHDHMRVIATLRRSSPSHLVLYATRCYSERDVSKICSITQLRSVRVMLAESTPSNSASRVADSGSCRAIVNVIPNLTRLEVPFEVDPTSCVSRSTLLVLRMVLPSAGHHVDGSTALVHLELPTV